MSLLSMEFLLKNLIWGIKDPLLFTKIVTERLSERPDRTATSHPTRTVPVPLAPAMCKGESILLPLEHLFPNRKALHVRFSLY